MIVRRGAGGGARIRTPQVANVARYIGLVLQSQGATLEDVHAARVLLEAPAAGMLASHEDRTEIVAALRDALDEEERVAGDPVELSRAYGRFHQLIVKLSGSETFETLTAVSNRIIQVQADRYMKAHKTDGSTNSAPSIAHRAHRRFVELVSAGAAQDAEELWRKHLEAGDAQLLTDPHASTVLDLLE
jgi:DNA-binding FadR family transcriptional regulator